MRKSGITANPEALAAILDADIIILGPGSLYTSIMPNLLVPGIAEAIRASRASLKAFVCNVATEPGETDAYTATDFVHALHRHVGQPLVDHVIINNNHAATKPKNWKSQVVQPGDPDSLGASMHMREADLVDDQNALRHDSLKLASYLRLVYEGGKHRNGSPLRMRDYTVDVAAEVSPAASEELLAGKL